MEFIAHRINTLEELKQVPKEFGVEIDLRDRGERLILQHDPFTDGEDFEPFLREYAHGTLILNIKSERIEWRVLELLKKYRVDRYFFLDCSFPMIHLLASKREKNVALRFSEFEGLDTILTMAGKVRWVWVDCFSRLPIDPGIEKTLKDAGFQLCLVSPELQGQPEKIPVYRDFLAAHAIRFDAICTKLRNIPLWAQPSPATSDGQP